MYAEKQYNPPELPPFHVFYDIENFWYTFEFKYIYAPALTEDGGNIFFSLQSKYVIDNTQPQIYNKYVSPFFKDDLKNAFDIDKKLNIWFETDVTNISPKKYDLIKPAKSVSFKQVVDTFENDPLGYQLQLPKKYSLDFGIKLLNDLSLQKTVYQFFEEEPPEDGKVTVVFKYNYSFYNINIIGNLSALVQPYIDSLDA
jgi:hypothetical protein